MDQTVKTAQESPDAKRSDIIRRVRNGEEVAVIASDHNILPVHVHNVWQAELRRTALKDVKQEIRAEVRAHQKINEPELTNARKLMLRANAFYEAGESGKAVCERLKINYNSFHAWRYAERRAGRLPATNMRPLRPRTSYKAQKAAKVSERHYEIQMPSRRQAATCQMCDWLESELRRVESENLNLRIASKRSA